MLLVAAFPLAYLAGVTTQTLTEGNWAIEARSALARGFRRVVLFLGLPTLLGLWFNDGRVWWAFVAYWLAAVLLPPAVPSRASEQHRGHRAQKPVSGWRSSLSIWLPGRGSPAGEAAANLYPSSPALETHHGGSRSRFASSTGT